MSAPKAAAPYKQIRALYDEATITVYQAYSAEIAAAAVAAQKLNASPRFRVDSRMTWIKPSWGWMLYRSGYSYKDKGQERILALRMRRGDFEGLLRGGVLTTHSTVTSSHSGGTAAATSSDGSEDLTAADSRKDSAAAAEEDSTASEPAAGSGDGNHVDEAGTGNTAPGDRDGSERGFKGRGRRRDKSKQQERPKSESVKVQWDPERSVRLERLSYRSIQIGIPGCLTKRWCEEMIVRIEDVTEKARELKRVLDADEKIELGGLVNMGLVPVEKEFEVPGDIRKLLGMDLPATGGERDPGEDRE